MPEDNTTPTTPTPDAPVNVPEPPNPAAVAAPAVASTAADATIEPPTPAVAPPVTPQPNGASTLSGANTEVYSDIASKIGEAHNVLIALSGDPSVDELAAAIGLSLYLDKLGKRATAIYSGATPNALEFLKPEQTFEPTVDALQDFVIALNKDKADHLRYKLDGDYVKVYITPYRTKITDKDLEFSYGDFNVDLVLALDVANGIDLDSALREHGRIMHDAVIINITTGNPGKFGEIEWSDKQASSVSEMVAALLYSVKSEITIGKEEATAFLTGIVAATNRFSNASTTPETMAVASKLMESGANQQLISKNITPDTENEMFSLLRGPSAGGQPESSDPTNLLIEHDDKQSAADTDTAEAADSSAEADVTEPSDEQADAQEPETAVDEKDPSLLEDLKAAEASLSQAGAETMPDETDQPVKIDNTATDSEPVAKTPATPTEPASTGLTPELPPVEGDVIPEKVITPPADIDFSASGEGSSKYGKMLEEALAEANNPVPGSPANISSGSTSATENPAVAAAPDVAPNPEINGVPSINYTAMPGEEILPPPPAPPVDLGNAMPTNTEVVAPASTSGSSADTTSIAPAIPTVETATPDNPPVSQPVMQDQVYAAPASDAFKIPGM